MLRITSGSLRRGRRMVLEPVTVEVKAPAAIALVGVNGSGKSSLFMQLTDTLLRGRGRAAVTIDGRTASLAYVPQVPALPGWPRVPALCRAFGTSFDALCHDMPQLLLHELAGRRVHQLSVGQRQTLLIALALSRSAEVTLLDEPFSALDFRRRIGALQLLEQHRTAGRSILLSSQSAADLAGVCTHFVVIRDARIVFNAPASHLSPTPSVDELERQLLALLL